MKYPYRRSFIILLPLILFMIFSCSSESTSTGSGSEETQSGDANNPHIAAAMVFLQALTSGNDSLAYDSLSSYAKARMTLNQFAIIDAWGDIEKNEKHPMINVTQEQFGNLMNSLRERYGTPDQIENLHVYTTDQDILCRRLKGVDAIECMVAIGAMPDSIPNEIRRASMRGEIITRLSPKQMEEYAKDYGLSVSEYEDQIKKDKYMRPFVGIKIVLVEEDSQLKAGYFEFVPPGVWD